jgi:hypothetical protein
MISSKEGYVGAKKQRGQECREVCWESRGERVESVDNQQDFYIITLEKLLVFKPLMLKRK